MKGLSGNACLPTQWSLDILLTDLLLHPYFNYFAVSFCVVLLFCRAYVLVQNEGHLHSFQRNIKEINGCTLSLLIFFFF